MPKTKKKTHKWIVTESISYEVEASTQMQAIKKFNSSPSAFAKVDRVCEAKSWLDSKKDEIADAIFKSMGLGLTGMAPAQDFTDDFWEERKKTMKSLGWDAGEMRSKYLDEGEEHPENSDDDHATISLVNDGDLVYWISIPKEDALKVLTLGAPF